MPETNVTDVIVGLMAYIIGPLGQFEMKGQSSQTKTIFLQKLRTTSADHFIARNAGRGGKAIEHNCTTRPQYAATPKLRAIDPYKRATVLPSIESV
jgi:hypothetical protein